MLKRCYFQDPYEPALQSIREILDDDSLLNFEKAEDIYALLKPIINADEPGGTIASGSDLAEIEKKIFV